MARPAFEPSAGSRAWRSAQPAPHQIRAVARRGLCTIINLRGERAVEIDVEGEPAALDAFIAQARGDLVDR